MPFMQWSDQFVTGFELIDEQHKKLVDLVNDVAPKLAAHDEVQMRDVAPLLNQLADYAVFHFGYEEDLMLTARIDPGYFARHQRLHNLFAQEIARVIQNAKAGNTVSGMDLLRYINDWLTTHILSEDQKMTRQLKAIGAGVPPDKAMAICFDEKGAAWKS